MNWARMIGMLGLLRNGRASGEMELLRIPIGKRARPIVKVHRILSIRSALKIHSLFEASTLNASRNGIT